MRVEGLEATGGNSQKKQMESSGNATQTWSEAGAGKRFLDKGSH